jgi:hypothetical protein
MQISQIIVTVLITTVIVAAIIFATAVSVFPRTVQAHAFGNWHTSGSAFGGQHGGSHRGHGGNPCARLDLPVGKLASVMVEEHLELNADQRNLLQPVTATLDAWRVEVKQQCDSFDPANIPAAMTAMETLLRSSADRIAELQPAYAAFHASLDDTQKQHIESALQHRHGRAD